MNILNNNQLQSLDLQSFDYPQNIKRIVFCDFDETYLPFNSEDKIKSGITALENFINENVESLSLIIGWVTGSSLQSALRKADGHIMRTPHFIASSLGTELHWIRGSTIQVSKKWIERINSTGFSDEKINELHSMLLLENVVLIKQNNDYQGKHKKSFYYKISKEMQRDIDLIHVMAKRLNIKASISKCNPNAGDPIDCYDVDLIPACCGKDEILFFLCDEFNISKNNTWAFGDSFNDFPMLKNAGNSYLVGNADAAAKEQFNSVLESNYCHGIKTKLEEILK